MTTPKKLIEVALPLEAINAASAREKSIRHGHPSTLHLWWARRPLAAARAVLFAQMVDDPSAHPDRFPTPEAQQRERQRLFTLIEQLVKWENTTNEDVLAQARDEIWKSWRATCAARSADILSADANRSAAWSADILSASADILSASADLPSASAPTTPAPADKMSALQAALFDPDHLPAFHDPFAGGGSLPLEAQRLGLEAYASDLNPVAVLINKAMIEIPPKFAGCPPVHPSPSGRGAGGEGKERLFAQTYRGAQGLAEDVRYYGQWMRDEAEKRIGHLYPPVEVTAEMARERPDLRPYVGRKLTVIAWLWARTVPSPNPAYKDVAVPLAATFVLSSKPGKEAYVQPVIEERETRSEEREKRSEERGASSEKPEARNEGRDTNASLLTPHSSLLTPSSPYRFAVRVGKPPAEAKNGTKLARGANFRCIMSGAPLSGNYIKAQGVAGRMGARLMAIVAEGDRGRVYLPPTPEHEAIAQSAQPTWKPENELIGKCRDQLPLYGMYTFADLFTPRQLVALTTFSDLVTEARQRVLRDAEAAAAPHPAAYADAVAVYLAMAVDRMAMSGNSLVRWNCVGQKAQHCFGRQALPMVWDFAEPNFLAGATGSVDAAIFYSSDPLNYLSASVPGLAVQADATSIPATIYHLVSTDPPYYDNVGYADLSDFFYVWLRRSLRSFLPSLFATLSVPKAEELVATPYRHGNKQKAEAFFLEGMTKAMHQLVETTHPAFPVTIYYAFKQSESDGIGTLTNTGWDTFLDAAISAGFAITGTWPIRTEMKTRQVAMDTNALASSIVLVCRKRPADAPIATRREFLAALRAELPAALRDLQRANIAPVDLAQAAIGPGMAVYTRYASVRDASGQPLSVREALALINQTLDEALAEQEGDLDADTRWALAWFEQAGFGEGEFGVAETLSKAKNTSISGLAEAGVLASARGKVRLLRPQELPADWDPARDRRRTVWEATHHLIRAHETGGDTAAAELAARLGPALADAARELAYRLYTLCERKKRPAEALAYNALVQAWPEIARLAQEIKPQQERLL